MHVRVRVRLHECVRAGMSVCVCGYTCELVHVRSWCEMAALCIASIMVLLHGLFEFFRLNWDWLDRLLVFPRPAVKPVSAHLIRLAVWTRT